eukprot:4552850-Prymnesium_polylepis.1
MVLEVGDAEEVESEGVGAASHMVGAAVWLIHVRTGIVVGGARIHAACERLQPSSTCSCLAASITAAPVVERSPRVVPGAGRVCAARDTARTVERVELGSVI